MKQPDAKYRAMVMQHFPNDENGDVLRRIVEHGENLNIPRDIDFSVVFADEASAERMAEVVRIWGFVTTVDLAQVSPSRPWDVNVVNYMLPTICCQHTTA